MADVTQITEQSEPPIESAKDRFIRTLKKSAEGITCVRNEVFTSKWWQIVVDIILGGGALGCLIASMIVSGTAMTVTSVAGIALVIAVILFNYILKSIKPTSFLQYTYIDKKGNRRLSFQVLSKTRATFNDGTHTVEYNRGVAAMLDEPVFPQMKFDFFAEMDPTERIGRAESEMYKGTVSIGEKTYKCKIVLNGGRPVYGAVGGCRIKYLDINNTKNKFVLPYELKEATKALGLPFPNIPGIYVRDNIKDLTKQ